MSVYNNINCEELNDFAKQAGLGDKTPVDFLQFKKHLKEGDKILEIGCGTGRIGKHLIKKYRYFGVDNYQPYLECFKDYLVKNNLKSIEKNLINTSFENYHGSDFDVVLFPWSVIWHFSENEQLNIIKKAKNLLKKEGLILIDNPAKGAVHNVVKDSEPSRFYFDEWESKLKEIFTEVKVIIYNTPVGRTRELIILKKTS